jgi:hypothetical protein
VLPRWLVLHSLGVLGLCIALGLELTIRLRLRRARTVAEYGEWGSRYQRVDERFPVMVLLNWPVAPRWSSFVGAGPMPGSLFRWGSSCWRCGDLRFKGVG